MDEFKIIRSRRKTLSMEITRDGKLVIRAPMKAPDADILAFVKKHQKWIAEKLSEAKKREEYKKQHNIEPLSRSELTELGKAAVDYIPMRVAHYAAIMGVDFGNITIRNQSTRWGSCSAKKNLNFNVLLMLAPREVLDSVIVHELCHIRHMNHSKAFYEEVRKYFPDYDKWDKWLKEHGDELMSRMPV